MVLTHLWHDSLALEAPAHPVVDTLWLSPARINTFESIGLVAVEMRSALLYDWYVLLRGGHLDKEMSSISSKRIERLWALLRLSCCVGSQTLAAIKISSMRIEDVGDAKTTFGCARRP